MHSRNVQIQTPIYSRYATAGRASTYTTQDIATQGSAGTSAEKPPLSASAAKIELSPLEKIKIMAFQISSYRIADEESTVKCLSVLEELTIYPPQLN